MSYFGKWTLWSSGERRVAIALAVVTLVGSAVGVTRRMFPEVWMGPPTFVAEADRADVPQVPASVRQTSGRAATAGEADGATAGPEAPIDLNAATPGRLHSLPGIGPVLAERIIVHRTDVGPFTSVDDLRNVPGIGEKRIEALEPFVTVGADGRNDP